MVVLTSLRRALAGLARNPVLFVAAGLLALLQLPGLVVGSVDPAMEDLLTLGFPFAYLLLIPLFQGGLIAMADEAITGRTRLRTLLRAGRCHYASLLGAELLFAVAVIGALVVVVGLLSVGVELVGSVAVTTSLSPRLFAIGLVVAALGVASFVVVLFVQFYAQAIVLDDYGAFGGFGRSVAVVRRNLRPTVGFTLVVWALSLVLGAIGTLASMVLSPGPVEMVPLPTPTLPEAVVLAVLALVANVVSSAVLYPYSVSFYRAVTAGQ